MIDMRGDLMDSGTFQTGIAGETIQRKLFSYQREISERQLKKRKKETLRNGGGARSGGNGLRLRDISVAAQTRIRPWCAGAGRGTVTVPFMVIDGTVGFAHSGCSILGVLRWWYCSAGLYSRNGHPIYGGNPMRLTSSSNRGSGCNLFQRGSRRNQTNQ